MDPEPMKTIVAYPAYKNRNTNPYQALLYDELSKHGWVVFDLDVAIRKRIRPDIVHLHWPDGFAFHKGLCKSLIRSSFLILLLSVYRLMGAKVVWTVHNLQSHEQYHPNTERCFWNSLYRRLSGWIALSEYSAGLMEGRDELGELPHAVIPLGVYPRLTDKKETVTKDDPEKTSFLFFGSLRSYKAVPTLIEAFSETADRELSLTIAGECRDDDQKEFLDQNAAADSRIKTHLRFLPNEDLENLIEQSDGIIIPYAGSLNSGVVFLAITYGKPVLLPKTPTFNELAQDFGKNLFLLDPPLRGLHISDFKKKINRSNADFNRIPEKYTWPSIGKEHDAYFRLLLKD
jgi:glycosyltransferase involved in cell wall biosynthesis